MLNQRKSTLAYPLKGLRSVITKWLRLEDEKVIDAIVACYVANCLSSDPLWLLIIGPPSHAKTELLRGLEHHQHNGVSTTYFISNLTPSTLVSGVMPKNGRPDPSLVFRLDGKLVVLKDFTSILSMRSENQQEIIAQLREMYDGQYSKDWGNGKSINWVGRFGLLGACTPVYDQHYGVVAQMGERFLLYRVDGDDDIGIAKRAQEIVGQEVEMRHEIMTAMHRFIDQFQNLSDISISMKDEAVNESIINLACMVARGRCPVSRDYRSGEVTYQPSPEGPARITKQLTQLGMGLAIVRESGCIDDDVLSTLQKVARDLMPRFRRKLLEYLWRREAFDEYYTAPTTTEIAEATGMVSKTALRNLEDLMLAGVLKRTRHIAGHETAPYRWTIDPRVCDYMRVGGLFDHRS